MKQILILGTLLITTAASTIVRAAEDYDTADRQGSDNVQELLLAQREMIATQQQQLRAQQEQLDQQRIDLITQRNHLQRMNARLDSLIAPRVDESGAPVQQDHATAAIPASQNNQQADSQLADQVATLEQRLASIPEDPLSQLTDEDFPGSLRLPGTTAAMRIGGFVKAGFAESFSPLASTDRFIVGSIPTGAAEPGVEEQTSFTANQSRLNLEFRDKTNLGDLRAFIEADFARSDDTLRLRHAYGQFRNFLTGQTWSTFYDPQAWPEEVDFEGLNGGTILRQPQVRWFPTIAKNWDLQIALEDPVSKVSEIDTTGSLNPDDPDFNPDFGNQIRAKGLTDFPDVIASIRRKWFGRWHLKTALVLHQVKGQYSQRSDLPDRNEIGWGIAESGVIKVPWLDPRDNLKFQVIYGDGIGRYVNDTNSIGGLDGVFTPDGSELKTLPITAGYVAYQHWWGKNLRSNFILSGVEIDNKDFQPDDAYKRTIRASTNLFWSPAPHLDLAIEYLWGERTNKNGDTGDAAQIQLMSKYGF